MFFILLLGLSALALGQTGARYLIIAQDDYYDAIQPLADWKTKKGMPCVVVRKSQIGTQADQIRSYIRNAYATWDPRPEFVLIVGAATQVPAFAKGRQNDRIYTDNCYGDMEGDYRVELPYGRFPCKNLRQCSVMVAKTLLYERRPDLVDSLWLRRATIIVADSLDSDAATYWSDARFVARLAGQAGFTSVDTLSSSRRDDARDITADVNVGTSFVLYRGTATDYWYQPFDMRPQFRYMTNKYRQPIVCSFTCQTVSLSPYNDSMTGNTWVRLGTSDALAGAVAVVGNTHSSTNVAGQRSAMTRGFFTRAFSDSLPYLGHAVMMGKMQIYNLYHDSMDYMGFNLLGDPELNVWTTTPQVMELSYDSAVSVGDDTFRILVERAGQPIANALVCLRHMPDTLSSDSVYAYGYTDSLGQARLPISTTATQELELTVTARNCLPFEGLIVTDTVHTSIDSRSPGPISSLVRAGTGGFALSPDHTRPVITVEPHTQVAVYDLAGRCMLLVRPSQDRSTWDLGR
ncbi:MAG: C25 family cysteine peptidase [candidate division WOR-3 bacterium]